MGWQGVFGKQNPKPKGKVGAGKHSKAKSLSISTYLAPCLVWQILATTSHSTNSFPPVATFPFSHGEISDDLSSHEHY